MICRSYLRRVVEAAPEIETAGARLVVVTPQSADRVPKWWNWLALPETLIIADPERTLYKALGARRPRPLWALRPRVVISGVRRLMNGDRSRLVKGDDPLLLGIDLVADGDGKIVFLHRASDPADRTSPAELIAVVRSLNAH